jgi:signal transduction histidine kinase
VTRPPNASRGFAARHVVAVCLLLVAAGWVGVLLLSRLEREETIRRVESENAFVASAFEEHARRIFKTADSILRFLQHEVEEGSGINDEVRYFGAMARDDLAAVQVAVADAAGDLVYSAVPVAARINIADRDHFRVHASRPDAGLVISVPVQARATGTWAFFLSRRVNRPDGAFGGVVTLGLDPFYFGKVYGNLRVGEDRVGIIVGTDHVVRVRIARGEPFVGDDISGFSPVFREAAARPTGSYEVVTSVGNKARFASYRAMPDFPLIVIVSAIQDEVLADWRRDLRRNAGIMAALTVIIAAFGALLITTLAKTRRREEEARELQERLNHAQKLEAIGTLAGGVAHDFNNMLGVILGQLEFAKEEAGPAGPLRESLEEIDKAAHRSVNVTRQLLAFARKQAIAPRVLDLNGGVDSILRMIRRLIGERIELRWSPGAGVWKVRIDPSQLDQLLTNLATNARDAISGAGTVAVGTANVSVDAAFAARVPGAVPGDYAVLTVGDTGSGIRPEDLPNIFEPFFTTKGTGKGTGLGLATVYGIVKQNGGFIDVESAPDRGSTFRLYLPRAKEEAAPSVEGVALTPAPRGGGETILVVEDELAKLQLVRKMLESIGYRVVATDDPAEALRIASREDGKIDLVVTDVVMPRMNGRELEEAIRRVRPDLRCLFMSGYPAQVMAREGVLEAGVDYLPKPFTRAALAEKVREILDRP